MFTLLKLIKPFLLPSTLIAVGMFLSFLFFTRRKLRRGGAILISTLIIYYLLSLQPVAYLLASTLEKRIPRVNISSAVMQDADAIVILAGGAQKESGYRPFAELNGSSWRRLWRGITLFQLAGGKTLLLYSGGSGDPFDLVSHEVELARHYALQMGIPGEKFAIESNSRNTYESGMAIKKFLGERFPEKAGHKIILVTSAIHMPRSLGVMKKVGIESIPAPADFSDSRAVLSPLSFFPTANYFSSSSASIHEWVGIWGYLLLKRI